MLPLRKSDRVPTTEVRRLEILVADDLLDIKDLLTLWLESAGHSVTRAGGGRELVALVKDKAFDLVITDIVMPDGDGWEAIIALNRLRPDIRIIAISGGGKHMPSDACLRVAKGVGADGVLKKPFRRSELLAAVESVMAR